jgi:hypothetical protein
MSGCNDIQASLQSIFLIDFSDTVKRLFKAIIEAKSNYIGFLFFYRTAEADGQASKDCRFNK